MLDADASRTPRARFQNNEPVGSHVRRDSAGRDNSRAPARAWTDPLGGSVSGDWQNQLILQWKFPF